MAVAKKRASRARGRKSTALAYPPFPAEALQRLNLGAYPQYLNDYYQYVGYAGNLYPLQQSITGWSKTEEVAGTLPNYMRILMKSPPAFAAQLVRGLVMSQARLIWRNRADRHIFRNADLGLLEQPWPNGTTGELLSRMEWSAGLAGNAYIYRQPDRLRVLRPDWVAIVYGSNAEPDDPKGALDAEVIGYAYKNNGWGSQNKNALTVLLPQEVAHWTPLPDPMSPGLGMSWLTPALRDLQGDEQATEYKLSFFTNGATPNLVIKNLPPTSGGQFQEAVDKMEAAHKGTMNAFKTWYLTGGADATVIGSNLQQLDLSSITSHGETRISYLSRVPAVILGIAAGLKGSSLNAGNYGEARRNFADSWYYSNLQDACAALESITNRPGGGQLWYDVKDVPLLREDAKDAAAIEDQKAKTIVSLMTVGFTPESTIAAVMAQDMTMLEHDERFISVQLQALATAGQPIANAQASTSSADQATQNGNGAALPKAAARSGWTQQESAPINLHFPDHFITVPVTVEPATVQAPVTVNLPPSSNGLDVLYDDNDKVIGTRPRRVK